MNWCPGCARVIWPWQATIWAAEASLRASDDVPPAIMTVPTRRWHRACWWKGWQS